MSTRTNRRPTALLAATFAGVFLFLAYFAVYPVWREGAWDSLSTTIYQMLLLAAIVAPYAIAVSVFGGDEEPQATEARP